MIEAVPEPALRFVSEACRQHAPEIRKLLQHDPKDPRFQLFECIRSARDYGGLYPFRKAQGATPAFYDFYQEHIREVDPAALLVARKLAGIIFGESSPKELKDIRKPEYVQSPAGRNRIRRAIADHLSLAEYDSLFPSAHHPVRVNPAGWQLIRFYLSQENATLTQLIPQQVTMKTTHPKIIQIGDAYFHIKGPKKIKNVLDRLAQRKLGIRWLQDVFCSLAEQQEDLNLGTWDEFACDEEGKPVVFELLFQMRLYLANKYRESMTEHKEMIA
jgi:hypothetical protein